MLRSYFERYENVSIRQFAKATNLSYHGLLKASKKPVEGEIYNPEAINWVEMEKIVEKNNVNLDDIDWKQLNEKSVTKANVVEKDIEQFTVGTQWYLRRNKSTPYTIVYRTKTHVVVQLNDSEDLNCWSWNTFMFQGPSATIRQ